MPSYFPRRCALSAAPDAQDVRAVRREWTLLARARLDQTIIDTAFGIYQLAEDDDLSCRPQAVRGDVSAAGTHRRAETRVRSGCTRPFITGALGIGCDRGSRCVSTVHTMRPVTRRGWATSRSSGVCRTCIVRRAVCVEAHSQSRRAICVCGPCALQTSPPSLHFPNCGWVVRATSGAARGASHPQISGNANRLMFALLARLLDWTISSRLRIVCGPRGA